MKRVLVSVCLSFLIGVAILSVSGTAKQSCPKPSQADLKDVARGNTAFALDLYRELAREGGNIVFSPISISTSLAMANAGARGDTAREMEQTLHFTLGQEKLHPAMAGLLGDLNTRGGEGEYELLAANRLWINSRFPVKGEFLELNSSCYKAEARRLAFEDQEKTAEEINSWTREKTKGKIEKAVEKSNIKPEDALIITNAVYMKGLWQIPFDPKNTRELPFYVTPDQEKNVAMMMEEDYWNYAETKSARCIELPYKGQDLFMLIVLPKDMDGLAKVESEFSPEILERLYMRKGKYKLYLPMFKLTYDRTLNEDLMKLGMKKAFGSADFSGISDSDIWIRYVKHQAVIEVDEKGTEAAAATSVFVTASASPMFVVDHPFMFLIMDKKTGTILFMGRVMDPRE